ncbi:hypothetical protein [Actinomadura algeriensis]|uniref:MFS transporter n=1 Tax=Actinomadura algeriensis TaxID=1679523 RepID=A0ABR9K3S7_9ACTN|nr:hypothetical protein [Actinomadura algeriensis]MBE1537505.1 hypothetical protein [Actinomadura algeriensis]
MLAHHDSPKIVSPWPPPVIRPSSARVAWRDRDFRALALSYLLTGTTTHLFLAAVTLDRDVREPAHSSAV